MKLLFGMSEDEKVEIVNVPHGLTVVKLRLRGDRFATVYVKDEGRIAVHYVQYNEPDGRKPYYTIGPIFGANCTQ